MTDDVTKYLKIPKIIGSDPLINLPDQNGRALDQIDAILGNPPRASLYSTADVTTGPKGFGLFPLDAVKYASDPTMKGQNGIRIPLDGLYIVSADCLITDPLTPAGLYREMIPLINNLAAGFRQTVGQVSPYHTRLAATWHIECAAGGVIQIQVGADTQPARFAGGTLEAAWIAPLAGASPIRQPVDDDAPEFHANIERLG
jgi:hypothetical protein